MTTLTLTEQKLISDYKQEPIEPNETTSKLIREILKKDNTLMPIFKDYCDTNLQLSILNYYLEHTDTISQEQYDAIDHYFRQTMSHDDERGLDICGIPWAYNLDQLQEKIK